MVQLVYLEQIDWKLGMDFGGDPAAEGLVNLFGGCDGIEHLVHVVETEVTVLQQHPAALGYRRRYDAPRMYFLALAHRYRTEP